MATEIAPFFSFSGFSEFWRKNDRSPPLFTTIFRENGLQPSERALGVYRIGTGLERAYPPKHRNAPKKQKRIKAR